MQTDHSFYSSSGSIKPTEKRISTLSISSKPRQDPAEYAVNRFSQKYDSYQEFVYRNQLRRRLSSTGDNSGDSSTTTSGSSCGERDEGSEGRAESDEVERDEEKEAEEEESMGGLVSDAERLAVETFFKGLKTQLFVSGSLANLYTKTANDQEWQLKYTGIPVVILDAGESRARDKRRIQIALAERGTCFMLWHDTIDNLSSYKVESASFHTMRYSSDHTVQVGFSFDNAPHAEQIWSHIERLVSCPENISLSTPGKKKKKKVKKAPKPPPLPPKSHISQPCCFQHITSVDRDDTSKFFSLKELLPRSIIHPFHEV